VVRGLPGETHDGVPLSVGPGHTLLVSTIFTQSIAAFTMHRGKGAIAMSNARIQRVALIGFGEVGGTFGKDLVAAGIGVSTFDILFCNEKARGGMLSKALAAKVTPADDLGRAIRDSELVISVVTASSASAVAREAANILRPGQFYLDANSVSPETKGKMAADVDKSGAYFVEAAVMAPVAPQRLKVPMLLGGSRSAELASALQEIGMDATPVSERIGVASAIKMCRSVVMKGLAAIAIESLFAARRYGAEDAVIASFEASYPNMGWAKNLPDSLTRRAVEHSRRRAAEMREVEETLKGAGIDPFMASSTANLQDWLTREMEAHNYVYKANEPFSWRAFADLIAPASKCKAS
jgi:3-hydroxyisobutyrate dehydrogenase-like beta-hydroxyacid dehydrogenase